MEYSTLLGRKLGVTFGTLVNFSVLNVGVVFRV